MKDLLIDNPSLLAIGAITEIELMRKRGREALEREKAAQAEREKKFGRHLTRNTICGIGCYPELIFEFMKLPTNMERVVAYNDAVARYEGNLSSTLSVKQFRKIANELSKE